MDKVDQCLSHLPRRRFQMDKIQSHYYGDSGTNLSSYLSRIESLAPCVMLVDEVEKFMRSNAQDSRSIDSFQNMRIANLRVFC